MVQRLSQRKTIWDFPLSIVMLVCAGGVLAQTSEDEELLLAYGDKTTVSIATGSKQTLRQAPAVATVITAEDIAAMGATDLDQVLETVPGLHVNRAPNMGATQYVIRGVYSLATPQVLMLQNGIPVTTLLVGGKGNLWGGLPLENVARIEVVRGPGSALYGADAYSGVINIITKTAEDIQGTEVGARIGAFASRDAWAQYGGALGEAKMAAYFRTGTTAGFKRTVSVDAQTRNDRLFGAQASLAPGTTNLGADSIDGSLDIALGKWRWRAGYKLRDNIGTYMGLASALDPVGKGRTERVTYDLGWNDQLGENWDLALDAAAMRYKQRYTSYVQLFPPGTRFPTGLFVDGVLGAPETSERQVRLSASATYSGFAGHRVRIGIGHEDLNMYSTRELANFTYSPAGVPTPNGTIAVLARPWVTPHRRLVNYVYAQDEWRFARDWTLTAGLRHDNYTDAGSTTNPRLALVWDASLEVTAKLLYGSAFRAPSFVEQYGTNNPISAGNPNLRPETTRTWEAAFSWQSARNLQLGVNFFRYAMRDIARTVANPAPAPGTTYANTGAQQGSGMEFEGAWDVSRGVRLTGNYSYQRSTDVASGTDAGYAPHHHIYARADWRFSPGWMASSQANWVGERKRALGDTRPDIADYTTFDVTVRREAGKAQWEFAASVRNLFNANALEPSMAPGLTLPNDLPSALRSFYLQAVYKL